MPGVLSRSVHGCMLTAVLTVGCSEALVAAGLGVEVARFRLRSKGCLGANRTQESQSGANVDLVGCLSDDVSRETQITSISSPRTTDGCHLVPARARVVRLSLGRGHDRVMAGRDLLTPPSLDGADESQGPTVDGNRGLRHLARKPRSVLGRLARRSVGASTRSVGRCISGGSVALVATPGRQGSGWTRGRCRWRRRRPPAARPPVSRETTGWSSTGRGRSPQRSASRSPGGFT